MTKYLLEGQESNRLQFRRLVEKDFDKWLPFYKNPKSTKYWDGIPKNPKQACKEQFHKIFERYEKELGGMNALILKNTNTLVGICGLLVQTVDKNEELEIGYSVLPEYWRNGYAFEAAQKCKNFAFEENFASSLISIIHIDNIPSQKVALKNGMGLDKSTIYKTNPVHIYRITN